ncbi:MAG: prepilin-type N-terminal cleavage/methylation domain-containing protein [Kiritimatiellae bacterium]|nr:prepilin-type N-terminal cleavage/methylation domain-containing protein [Kiritimatiellia bacterium]
MKKRNSGFTLVEIMVVVAVVGMLMAGLFKLISATGENTKKARTVARLQRIQNALAGFYAENGTYPPVQQFCSPNPYKVESRHDGKSDWNDVSELTAANANRAAGAQSVAFFYPNVKGLNEMCVVAMGKPSVNASAEANRTHQKSEDVAWDNCRIFKFGLLSYLVPRVEMMGGEDLVAASSGGSWGDGTPEANFFKTTQWGKNNVGTIRSVHEREQHQCARWMPHLEGCISGVGTILGENVRDTENDRNGTIHLTVIDGEYVLQYITLKDGWGNEFYYYSAPPYQSYRLWSAGPDGTTFPPWITMETLKKKKGDRDAKLASHWIEDDIVRFDR